MPLARRYKAVSPIFLWVLAAFVFVFLFSYFVKHTLADTTIASDAFGRSVSSGWGTSDTGGAWTTTGTGISTSADFNVTGSEGTISLTAANQNKTALLSSTSNTDVNATVKVKIDKVPVTSTSVVYLTARHVSSGNEYRGRLLFNTAGTITIQATKLVGGTETTLGSASTASGLTFSANTYIHYRFNVTGTNPTTLTMTAWADGNSEPGSAQYTTTDSESVLQAAGAVGIQTRLSTTTSNAPILNTFDDYSVTSDDVIVTPTPTPTPTPAPTSAADAFARTVSAGWGTADTGGSYTLTGTAADFNVTSGQATINMPAAGASKYAMLNSVSMQDTDMQVKVKIDTVPTTATSADAGAALIVRRVGSDEYRARLKFTAAGTTTLNATKLVSNTETTLGSTVNLGITPTTNTYVWIRGQFTGTSPTTIKLRAWVDGQTEPTSWQITTTDSDATLQASGSVGVRTSLPTGVSNPPILFTFASLTADPVAATPTPTATPTYNLTGTVYNDSDGNGVQDVGESGYSGATVTLTGIGSTTTNGSGSYTFSAVPSATYTETLTLPSGYINTTTNPTEVPITSNTTSNFGIQSSSSSTIVSDTFTRTTTDSWDTADTGGAYTQTGTATSFSTDGSVGLMNMTGTGSVNQRTMRLDSATGQNVDFTIKVRFDKLADIAAGNYIFLIARHVSGGNEYRGWVRFDNSGGVHLRASKIVSSSETALGNEVTVNGLTYSAGNWLNVHLQLVATSPTTINLRTWASGDTEPSTWQYSTTDSSTILQQSGSLGVLTRLGAVTNTPVVASFDDFSVVRSTIVTPTPTPTASPTPVPTTTFDFPSNITKVFTIVMENQDFSNIKGNTTSAPYLNSLITGVNADLSFNTFHSDVSYASNYKSVLAAETGAGYLHPSLPNYIWLEAGTNVFSDKTFSADTSPSTDSTSSVDHIAKLMYTAGKTWRAYQENKPSGCPIGNGTLFVPRHSPFVYFQDISSLSAPTGVGSPSSSSTYCSANEFDYTQLATDLATGGSAVADYNFITPNLCDDMHDSGCAGATDKVNAGDTWLQSNLPTILNSSVYQAGHAAVFVLWDEDSGSTSNRAIGMISISPKTKGHGYTNSVAYSHSSYVKTVEEIFGLTPLLGHAADTDTKDFADLFGDPVIAAAGDIACGVGSGSASCQQSGTATLLSSINPSAILPLGDNQYEQGALSDFQSYYDPTWGVYKALTAPSVGNHEYLTTNASGYFDYFNGVGNQAGLAGDRSKGYYSYNLGNWHLIALNTNCTQAGGCGSSSTQGTWLAADLAATSNKCILAYAHHPRYTSGQQPYNSGVGELYAQLYSAHADVFLAGHDHDYERFYPSDNSGFVDTTNGITEFVVGTGGRNFTHLSSNGIAANSAVFDDTTFGVLKMTLHNSSFDWEFVPSASTQSFTNGTFTDSGTGSCHFASSTATPTATPTSTPVSSYALSGTVYHDTNANGVQDNGEAGYSGITISLTGSGTGSSTTDTNGAYSFSTVNSGNYTVTAHLVSGYVSTTTNPETVSLTADTTVNFGIGASTSSFQPTAPYYGTFFYNWYKNPSIDGTNQWGIWSDPDTVGSHSPSSNWYSNYLPQPTATFEPSTDLYSSNDYDTFKWQLTKMAQAKQEIAIASWWGQGDRSDIAFSHQITDYMARSDNPYPNLRWALYYECEGNTCSGTSNPSVSQITSDLNYIETNYANQPSYLKINGKPVIFVYADPTDTGTSNSACTDSSMTSRWYQASNAAARPFYVVLKVFGSYASGACQPDSWHQYAPAVRTDQQGSYSYMVSPGFWRVGDAVRLNRDLSSFASGIQSMVAASSTWKLTETWNEWGEGSAVEPGIEVTQTNGATPASQNVNGTTFGEAYINALNIYLPELESGLGTSSTPAPTPTAQLYGISGAVYIDSNENGVQDNGETGYLGATVSVTGVTTDSTTTDSSGNYSFTSLNQGFYSVSLTLPTGYTNTTSTTVGVPLTTNTSANFGIKTSSSPSPNAVIVISGVSVTPSNTSAIVRWNTNELSDSEVYSGLTSLYGTSQTQDIDGVTTHEVTISNLLACATYHYQIKSINDVGDSATELDNHFTTSGCNGNSTVLSETGGLISQSTGGSLSLLDVFSHGIKLSVPSLFKSSSAVFQIHQLMGSTSIASLSLPSNYHIIDNFSYDIKAFSDSSSAITSFDQPLTITIYYSDGNVSGDDPTTLKILQYHGGAWSALNNCVLDRGARTLSCETSSFSLFVFVNTDSTSSSSTSNNSANSSGSPVCTSLPPVGTPLIYEVDSTNTTATLYFAPVISRYNAYIVSYGPNLHDDYYAYSFDQGATSGALKINIGALSRGTYYTFKVKGVNGCAGGDWSRDFTARTGFLPIYKNKYFLWQQRNLFTILKKAK